MAYREWRREITIDLTEKEVVAIAQAAALGARLPERLAEKVVEELLVAQYRAGLLGLPQRRFDR